MASTIDYREFLRRLPKAELHCHIVGTMRPATLAELARRQGMHLPRPVESLYRYANFYDFIEIFRLAASVLVKLEDFARVAYEYIEDANSSSNLRHIELFFNPSYHYPHGVSYRTQLDGLIEGIRAAGQDYEVEALLVPSIDREFSPAIANTVLDDVLAYRREWVVGIGMDGPEDKGPPATFAEVFQRAGRAGLKRTAHVCEDYAPTPAVNYAVCRDMLGCDRLDHGYRVLTDPAVAARARDEGMFFTCCPKPSTRERDATRLDAIGAMAEHGLSIGLATDDPAMFDTNLADSFERACFGLGWGPERAQALALASLDASWLDERSKQRMRREFETEIDALVKRLDRSSVPAAPR